MGKLLHFPKKESKISLGFADLLKSLIAPKAEVIQFPQKKKTGLNITADKLKNARKGA